MASTAGARHLAESQIWLAAQEAERVRARIQERRFGTLVETAVQHMDPDRVIAFLRWLDDALEGNYGE